MGVVRGRMEGYIGGWTRRSASAVAVPEICKYRKEVEV